MDASQSVLFNFELIDLWFKKDMKMKGKWGQDTKKNFISLITLPYLKISKCAQNIKEYDFCMLLILHSCILTILLYEQNCSFQFISHINLSSYW